MSLGFESNVIQRVDVRVLHDLAADLFYSNTGKDYIYGVNFGGYGRRELATLYLTRKLSLSRDASFPEVWSP